MPKGRPFNGSNQEVYNQINSLELDGSVIIIGMNWRTIGNFIRGCGFSYLQDEMKDKEFRTFNYGEKTYVTRVK